MRYVTQMCSVVITEHSGDILLLGIMHFPEEDYIFIKKAV